MKKNEYAEVKFISADGFLIDVCGNTYFAAFKDFPYLYDLPISEAYNIEYLGQGDIRWDSLDNVVGCRVLPVSPPPAVSTDRRADGPARKRFLHSHEFCHCSIGHSL